MSTNSNRKLVYVASLAIVLVALFSATGCKGPVYPMCKNDSHCKIGPAGEALTGVCVYGQCQECAMNSDCSDGKECVGNVCKSNASTDADSDSSGKKGGDDVCSVENKTVHFDFDKYEVNSGDSSSLRELATCLRENANISVVLEGHTDERGSTEYNLALGQRRSEAVATHLSNDGVARSRLKTISYGKEKPVDTASNEEAWAANRRTEIKAQ